FSGTGEAGATVTLTINGKNYSTEVLESGTWSLKVSDLLSDGDYDWTVVSVDKSGNRAEESGQVTIDTVTEIDGGLDSNSDSGTKVNYTNDKTPTFTGTGEIGATVTLVINKKSYNVKVDESGNWEINVPNELKDGDYDWTAIIEDSAGNREDISGKVTIDTLITLDGGLDQDSDSGDSKSDGISNIKSPTFKGTGEVGAEIKLHVNGKDYHTVVDSEGNWSVAVTDELPDGKFNWSVTAVDGAGNEKEIVGKIEIDTTTSLTARLDQSSDSGDKNNDNITREQSPSFSGTGEAGSKIKLTINNQDYSTTVGEDGSWFITVSDELPTGDHNWVVVATDKAGNTKTERGSINVDTSTTVSAHLESDSDSGEKGDKTTSSKMPWFAGEGEAGATVTLNINGKNYSTTVGEDGTWRIQVTDALPDKEYVWTVVSNDIAGNEKTTSGTVEIDSSTTVTARLAQDSDTGSNTSDGITASENIVFSGVGEEGSKIVLEIDGQRFEATVEANGKWEVTVGQLDGNQKDGIEYNWKVTSTDKSGNTDTDSGKIVVDTTDPIKPTLNLRGADDTGLKGDWTTNKSDFTLSGKADFGTTVIVRVGSDSHNVSVKEDGTWTLDVSGLDEGNHLITIVSTDKAGNSSTHSKTISIDKTNTVAGGIDSASDKGTSNSDGITKETRPAFSGSTDADSDVVLRITKPDGSVITLNTQADSTGKWVISGDQLPSDFADGEYSYVVESTDPANNTVTHSGDFEIDTSINISIGLDDLTNSNDKDDVVTNFNKPRVSGRVDAGDKVEVKIFDDKGQLVETVTATVNSDGTWYADAKTELDDGNYEFRAKVTDTAGNSMNKKVDVLVDTKDPEDLTVNLHAESDTGSTGNWMTQDNTPRFVGTVEAGCTVELTINHKKYYAQVDEHGNWEALVANELSDGEYSFTVVAKDVAGNTTEHTGSITIDKTNSLEFELTDGQDSGWSDTDGITSENKPVYIGKTDPFSRVTITMNTSGSDKKEVVVTANANGEFTLELSEFFTGETVPDGAYDFTVVSVDQAGNKATSNEKITVDTVNPRSLTVELDDNSNSGDKNDWVTNDNRPVITGTVEAGCKVWITINGKKHPINVNEDGSWTFSAPELPDGEYDWVVRAEDKSGNASVKRGDIVIDTAPPTDVSGRLASVSETGINNNDGITKNNSNLTFSGTTESGTKVVIKILGESYEANVRSDGSWTVTVNKTWPDGEYDVQVIATDTAGNVNDDVWFKFEVDTVKPTITEAGLHPDDDKGESSTDGITNVNSPRVVGKASADVVRVYIKFEGESREIEGVINPDGTYSINLSDVSDGTYKYNVYVEDRAGNYEKSPTKTMVVDTKISASVELDASTDSGKDGDWVTNTIQPKFKVKTEPQNLVHLEVKDASGAVVFTKTTRAVSETVMFELTKDLPDGHFTFVMTTTDKAGNRDVHNGKLEIKTDTVVSGGMDSTSDTGVADDNLTNQKNPTFSGKADPNATIHIAITGDFNGIHEERTFTATADGSGNWKLRISDALSEGDYTYKITSVDHADNTSSQPVTGSISVDLTAPNLTAGLKTDTGVKSDDNHTAGIESGANKGHLDFSGSSTSDDLWKVQIVLNGKTYTVPVNGDGTWEFVVPDKLADGTYSYQVFAYDLAGNKTEVTGSVKLDTQVVTSATLSSDSDTGDKGDNLTNLGKPSVSGTGESGLTITATLSGHDISSPANLGSTTTNDKGEWEFDLSKIINFDLTDGSYTINYSVTDAAGNKHDDTYTFNVDRTPPVIGLNDYNGKEVDVNKPLISGTTEPNSKVVLEIDGESYTVTSDKNGNWRFEPEDMHALPDGEIHYTITAYDKAGNSSEKSDFFYVNTGTSVEGGLSIEDDTGFYDTDGITQVKTPTFKGIGDANAEIKVTIRDASGKVVQTLDTVVDRNGMWTVKVPSGSALDDGKYTYVVEAKDKSDNTASTEPKDLVIDNSVIVETLRPWTGSYGGGRLVDGVWNIPHDNWFINGKLKNNDANAKITVTINGVDYIGNTDDAGNFSVRIPLKDGIYDASIKIEDAAGNTTSQSMKLKVDTSTDEFTVNNNDDVIGDDNNWVIGTSNPTFSGTQDADNAWQVSIRLFGLENYNFTFQLPKGVGNWDYTIPADKAIADGSYSYDIVYWEQSGRYVYHKGSLVVDTVNELIGIDKMEKQFDDEGNWETTKMSGFAEGGADISIFINGVLFKTVKASNGGSWSVDLPFDANGDYDIKVVSTDVAKNTCELEETLVIDFIENLTVDIPNGGEFNPATTPLGGTGDEGIALTIKLTDESGKVVTKYASVQSDGTWTVDLSGLKDGVYTYKITGTTNWDKEELSGDFVVNASAPEIEYVQLDTDSGDEGDWVTNVVRPTISGKVEADAVTVTIQIGGTKYVSGVDFNLNADGTFAFTRPTDLSDGEHNIKITAVDSIGNESVYNGKITILGSDPEVESAVLNNDSGIDGDWITNNTTPSFSGKVSATVSKMTITFNGADYVSGKDFHLAPDGTWSLSLPDNLSDGDHSFKIQIEDAAGNTNTFEKNLHIDTVAPTCDGGLSSDSDVGNGVTGDLQPIFEGTGEAGASVVVTIDGIEFKTKVDAEGNWKLTWGNELSEGQHLFVFYTEDAAGNRSNPNYGLVVIDKTAPDVALTPQVDGDGHTDALPEFTGTGEAGATVTVTINNESHEVKVTQSGQWSLTWPTHLEDGTHTVEYTSTDAAGNVSQSSSVDIIVNTPDPVEPPMAARSYSMPVQEDSVEHTDESTHKDMEITEPVVVFGGNVAAGDIVEVCVDDAKGEVIADASGAWEAEIALEDLGLYSYTINVTNSDNVKSEIQYGTISLIDASEARDLDYVVESEGSDDVTCMSSSPVFSGVSDAGSLVELKIEDKTYSAKADKDGTWSIEAHDAVDFTVTPYTLSETTSGHTEISSGNIILGEPMSASSAPVVSGLESGTNSFVMHDDYIGRDIEDT
ncbi:Ig-like domain-containing protein, partial [Vibrio sp. D431a]|uniref:Ig-like domain-containing protein n=1 Tax=Vibrio sp. D431a TaxID=2837388 RepID=UPI0025542830